jgi:hypothetical protein
MKINSDNIIIITTTLPNNSISEKRRNNLIKIFNKYKIPILFNQGKKELDKTFYNIMKNRLEVFIKTKYNYAILCDDDFNPIDNFLNELNKTVKLLPDDWECLHLCPGYLWGRNFRDNSKIESFYVPLNPEYSMKNIPYHKSGRFYNNTDYKIYEKNKFWLGGPIAILVNKNNVSNILKNFINNYSKNKANNDIVLTRILNTKSFICRKPQLGYENGFGNTTFNM